MPAPLALVIDDDRPSREVTTALLRALAWEAVAVADRPAALAQLAAGRFDLVLTDVSLGEADGFQVLTDIRAAEGAGGWLPVVAVTSYSSEADCDRCLAAGFDDVLPKPLSLGSLLAVLVRHAPRTGRG